MILNILNQSTLDELVAFLVSDDVDVLVDDEEDTSVSKSVLVDLEDTELIADVV